MFISSSSGSSQSSETHKKTALEEFNDFFNKLEAEDRLQDVTQWDSLLQKSSAAIGISQPADKAGVYARLAIAAFDQDNVHWAREYLRKCHDLLSNHEISLMISDQSLFSFSMICLFFTVDMNSDIFHKTKKDIEDLHLTKQTEFVFKLIHHLNNKENKNDEDFLIIDETKESDDFSTQFIEDLLNQSFEEIGSSNDQLIHDLLKESLAVVIAKFDQNRSNSSGSIEDNIPLSYTIPVLDLMIENYKDPVAVFFDTFEQYDNEVKLNDDTIWEKILTESQAAIAHLKDSNRDEDIAKVYIYLAIGAFHQNNRDLTLSYFKQSIAFKIDLSHSLPYSIESLHSHSKVYLWIVSTPNDQEITAFALNKLKTIFHSKDLTKIYTAHLLYEFKSLPDKQKILIKSIYSIAGSYSFMLAKKEKILAHKYYIEAYRNYLNAKDNANCDLMLIHLVIDCKNSMLEEHIVDLLSILQSRNIPEQYQSKISQLRNLYANKLGQNQTKSAVCLGNIFKYVNQ